MTSHCIGRLSNLQASLGWSGLGAGRGGEPAGSEDSAEQTVLLSELLLPSVQPGSTFFLKPRTPAAEVQAFAALGPSGLNLMVNPSLDFLNTLSVYKFSLLCNRVLLGKGALQ